MENKVLEMMEETNMENPEVTITVMEPDYSARTGRETAVILAAGAALGLAGGFVAKKVAPYVKKGFDNGRNFVKRVVFKKKETEEEEEE